MTAQIKKLDLRVQYKHLYQPGAKKVEVVDVPALQFAMVDGQIEAGETPGSSPALDLLRLETFHEGLSLQIMRVGPYAEEPATIEKLHAFALENGYRLRGKHHEIYLGDPRRADPAKLKTVLRQPVERVAEGRR